jgi:hypothetical protein
MSNAEAREKVIKILSASAAQRFGEERADSLQPAIQEMAQSLVAVAGFAIALEEEPAFFS